MTNRKGYGNLQAALFWLGRLNLTIMGGGNGAGDGQTDSMATSLRVSGRVCPVKALKQTVQVSFRQGEQRDIANRQSNLLSVLADG